MRNMLASPRPWLAALTVGTAALLAQAPAQAQQGPEPTLEQLESGQGPYTYATAKVPTPSGYGSGTVYYPTNAEGPVGLVVTAPGFIEAEDIMDHWAKRLASFGIATVTMGTKSVLDQPPSRATQMMAALKQVSALSKVSNAPYYNLIDTSRLAVMGHSMGGGGTLIAATANPTLKAAIPAAPWSLLTKNFPKLKVPTMVIACQGDVIAPVSGHADRFWASFSKTLPATFVEYGKTDHFCPTAVGSVETQAVLGRIGVAWMKRFVDGDTRYTQFISTDPRLSRFLTKGSF